MAGFHVKKKQTTHSLAPTLSSLYRRMHSYACDQFVVWHGNVCVCRLLIVKVYFIPKFKPEINLCSIISICVNGSYAEIYFRYSAKSKWSHFSYSIMREKLVWHCNHSSQNVLYNIWREFMSHTHTQRPLTLTIRLTQQKDCSPSMNVSPWDLFQHISFHCVSCGTIV